MVQEGIPAAVRITPAVLGASVTDARNIPAQIHELFRGRGHGNRTRYFQYPTTRRSSQFLAAGPGRLHFDRLKMTPVPLSLINSTKQPPLDGKPWIGVWFYPETQLLLTDDPVVGKVFDSRRFIPGNYFQDFFVMLPDGGGRPDRVNAPTPYRTRCHLRPCNHKASPTPTVVVSDNIRDIGSLNVDARAWGGPIRAL